jgi:hypothetical protein
MGIDLQETTVEKTDAPFSLVIVFELAENGRCFSRRIVPELFRPGE